MDLQETVVDGIPVAWVGPDRTPVGAALWLHSLGGSIAQSEPMLYRLAERGLIAVCFDAPGHGARGDGDPWGFASATLAAFRRRMWPQLGRTTLEALRVLDWIDASFGELPQSRVAGGLSMGGDVAVAVAGIDARIGRVSAVVSTPDWTRPGMRELNSAEVLDQGEADAYARSFYDMLDPLTHVERYRRDVAIDFQCGADDHHVPTDGAVRFRDALVELDAEAANRIRVDDHPGVSHVKGLDPLYDNAVDWLTTTG